MRPRSTIRLLSASVLLLTTGAMASAQTTGSAPIVSRPSGIALSPALSGLPDAHWAQGPQDLQIHPPPVSLPPHAAGAGGPNAAATQTKAGAHLPFTPQQTFFGIGANGYIPPDPNIAVGTTYIVQVVNSQFAVFDKLGTLLSGPKTLSSIWSALGGGCAKNNAGDPVVQYDKAADRWIITQLGSVRNPYSECIAVSTTSDPRGSYYLYAYSFGNNLNDYPKFGIWPTTTNPAYLATYNMFANGRSFAGAQLCAYDRTAMLAGKSNPASICYLISRDGGFLPSDMDGSTAPSDGSPGYFLNFETLSSLRLYKLTPNFALPSSSTLTGTADIPVDSFSEACNGGACIPQPSTTEKLDSLGDRLMYRLAYRNFGDHEAMVVNHSVVTGSSVGVRWYELQAPAATPGQFSRYQQGTFAPDSTYRWMGSMAMDQAGDIALGYSNSASSLYPAIAVTGRTPDTTLYPLGTMGAEQLLQAGGGSQTGYTRWGDYTSMRIDPSDDCTFWYTNEYYTKSSVYLWSTFIGSFKIPSGVCATPTQ